MAKLSIVAGTTSKLVNVFIQDSSSTTGAGLTGLTNGSSGLTWYYYLEGAASAVQVTSIASMTLGTWTSKGFIVIDGTNMPGCYQLGIPDAALAAGSKSVIMLLKGVTNMAPLVLEIELTAVNNQDAVRYGLTALPNVASGSAGAIPTTGTGSNQISVSSGQVILQSGTGTGQLSFASGVVKANLTQVNAHAVTDTISGLPNVNATYFGSQVQTPVDVGSALDSISNNTVNILSYVSALPTRPTKGVALSNFPFSMVLSSDHVTPATGLIVTAQRSIDAGAFAACANSPIEISSGWYQIDLADTDMNGDTIALKFTAATADQLNVTIVTEPNGS